MSRNFHFQESTKCPGIFTIIWLLAFEKGLLDSPPRTGYGHATCLCGVSVSVVYRAVR